jgi:hypothetical protein
MNHQTAVQSHQKAPTPLLPGGILQRKCDCGQHTIAGNECSGCSEQRDVTLQRSAISHRSFNGNHDHVPPIVQEVLRSPGQPLNAATRAFMEPRFDRDFSHVRIHSSSQAGESARSIGARAYTVGHDVVFGAGQYSPESAPGRHLLAHELTHVIQQENGVTAATPQRQIESIPGGGFRIPVGPALADEFDTAENQADAEADAVADRVVGMDSRAAIGPPVQIVQRAQRGVHRVRIPLPNPVPLCGRSLTHIDVEPPRARPLMPCTPLSVTRINIVGREVSPATTGRGRMIFNLHIGYFRNATGHLCAIVDDSLTCVAPRCLSLGCFPTLQEVLDAIWNFLKAALAIIGIILLAILIALLLRGFRGVPEGEPMPGMEPVMAGGRGEGEGGGGSSDAGGGETAVV